MDGIYLSPYVHIPKYHLNHFVRLKYMKFNPSSPNFVRGVIYDNKAGYTATEVACEWAGAVIEIVYKAFGQEQ